MRTNQPNPFFNFLPSIKFDKYIPINIPITDMPVKLSKNSQSIIKFSTSPINPINDLIAIINNDVATAFFIGSLANKTKAGIIKNPPPAPTIPVSIPTTNPSTSIRG